MYAAALPVKELRSGDSSLTVRSGLLRRWFRGTLRPVSDLRIPPAATRASLAYFEQVFEWALCHPPSVDHGAVADFP